MLKEFENNEKRMLLCPICNKIVDYAETLRWGVKWDNDPTYQEIVSQNDGYQTSPEIVCPICHSFDRHRLYTLFFEFETDLFRRRGQKILHFAPESGLYKLFSQTKLEHDYYPVDLNPDYPGIRAVVDITNIPFADGFFDVVIANHVMEHIPNDKLALQEIFRVLKPDGVAYLNVPIFPAVKTLEDPSINTPELRRQFYGQFDHVRAYGLDYADRLRTVFPVVEQINYISTFTETEHNLFGIGFGGDIYCCKKTTISEKVSHDSFRLSLPARIIESNPNFFKERLAEAGQSYEKMVQMNEVHEKEIIQMNQEHEKEINQIFSSASFRLGRFITFIPRKIRKLIQGKGYQ